MEQQLNTANEAYPHTTNIQTGPFHGLFSGTIWVSPHQNKQIWILMKQETMGWQ